MFSKASSSNYRALSHSSHELPRWRSPSPMAASMIPPPIVRSTYMSPPGAAVQSAIISKASPLEERHTELESDLQYLLNAQDEGLAGRLEGGLQNDQVSTGSTTPTAQSVRSASARRTTRPVRRKMGLSRARKGIYKTIMTISSLKDEELRDIYDEALEHEKRLEQIDDWESKRQGLQEATKSIDASEGTIRVQRLHDQANQLQEEIHSVELQLADMKARHRKLVRQANSVENTVQAKMASYTESLRLLEDDVQKFLSIKPASNYIRPNDNSKSMWDLPAKRRTLDMAKQHWSEQRNEVLERRRNVEHDKVALDEGASVWKEVVVEVTDFEKRLSAEFTKVSESSISQQMNEEEQQRLKELLEHMDTVTESLESKLAIAQDRSWRLLMAAIGAEVAAMKEGKVVLQNLLSRSSSQPAEDLVDAGLSSDSVNPDGSEAIHELDKSFETEKRRLSNGTDSDDPDPELLFSKQDTDTE